MNVDISCHDGVTFNGAAVCKARASRQGRRSLVPEAFHIVSLADVMLRHCIRVSRTELCHDAVNHGSIDGR